MKRLFILCACLCLLLSGCHTILDGNYLWTSPHQIQENPGDEDMLQATNYDELLTALAGMAENGTENGIIYISQYASSHFEKEMKKAVKATLENNPIAAYAVDEILWEEGTSSGQKAVAVSISYLHNRTEIRKIQHVATTEQAEEKIFAALKNVASGLVLYLEDYEHTDFLQSVEKYTLANPQYIMETPQITVNVYPRWGASRVIELKFAYQTPKDSLENMQRQVAPIFSAARLYVTGDAEDYQKFSQLYSFLTERFEYKFETSVTPAYSLLRHGVGDSKAFSTVYAAMCQTAGLECQVVSGTHLGERWYWNLIYVNGNYYHLDLLMCSKAGFFQMRMDDEMQGYVWDYSAYPATPEPAPPAPTEPEYVPPTTEPILPTTEPTI